MANSKEETARPAAKNQTDAAGPAAKTTSRRRTPRIDPVRQPAAAALDIPEDELRDGRVPRWVRNDPIRIDQLRQIGYEVDKDEDGEKRVVRDMVRMSIPVEDYQERLQMKNARGRDLLRAGSARFRDTARAANVTTEDTTTSRVGTEADAD
jgi:hypothetical protein